MRNNKSMPPGYSFFPSMVRTYKQANNPISTMQESMSRFNGTYTVNMGMMRIIATQNPGLIDHVLKSNHRNYQKSEIQNPKFPAHSHSLAGRVSMAMSIALRGTRVGHRQHSA